MKCYAIEGNTLKLDGGAMFGNAPKVMWQEWLVPDEQNRIPLAARSLLLQTADGKNILFEAGVGAFFEPKLQERFGIAPASHQLLASLQEVGVDEREIDAVILSHLHFDHAGGLLPAYGKEPWQLHFPRASYYVSKEHWEYAQNPHPREKASFLPELHKLLASSGRLVFVDGPQHKNLDFGLSFWFSEGHTKGLMLAEISLEPGPLLFASDLIPGNPWVHLPLSMGYDRFPERKIDEKKRVYDAMLPRGGILFYTHDPETAAARLKQDAKGKYYGEPIAKKNAAILG